MVLLHLPARKSISCNISPFHLTIKAIDFQGSRKVVHKFLHFVCYLDQGSQLLLQKIRLLLKLWCFQRIIFSECEIKELKYTVCLALIIGRIVFQIGHDVLYNR